MTIERHPITDKAEWLSWRKKDVTASQVAALAGLSTYMTPLQLFAEKTGLVADQPDSAIMRRGRWLEPGGINALKEYHPDWHISQPGMYLRDPEARLGATPDAVAVPDSTTDFDSKIIQIKIVAKPQWEAGWQDGVPAAYVLQTLTEMMLWGANKGIVAALVLDAFTCTLQEYPIERHPGAEQKIKDMVARFWTDTDAGKAPAADYNRDLELLKILYKPRPEIEALDLSSDNYLTDLLAERERVSADEKRAAERLDAIKAELTAKLNGSPIAICNGWRISHKMQHRNEVILKATDYPVLRVTKLKEKQL